MSQQPPLRKANLLQLKLIGALVRCTLHTKAHLRRRQPRSMVELSHMEPLGPQEVEAQIEKLFKGQPKARTASPSCS